MSFVQELEICYCLLDSNKITDRKKGLENLTELLNNSNIIESLNNRSPSNWKKLLEASQKCLKKECEKIANNNVKKGITNSRGVQDRNFELSCSLMDLIIKLALKQGKDEIKISKIVKYIYGCWLEEMMKICMSTFLSILKNYVLPKLEYLGELESDDFLLILQILKSEIQLNFNATSKSNELVATNCLMSMIKNGPLAAFSPHILRKQFPFITKLCRSLSRDSPRPLQVDVMNIALNFCIHTVEDNRIACAKFGESVFHTFLDLYLVSGNDSSFKVDFLEFCLVQITIHNPNGACENQPEAYAHNWHNWKMCIKKMYNFLTVEISHYFRFSVKNTAVFIPCHNKLTTILDTFVIVFVEVCNQMLSDKNASIYSSDDSISSSSTSNYSTYPIEKRRKCEVSLTTLIENISSTRSWVWIKLVGALINKYPKLIDEKNIVDLLKILHSLLLDEKNTGTTNYIYECQAILLDILPTNSANGASIDPLEKLIGDSTLRAIGLNKDIKETQQLLQKLIKRKTVNLDSVIETYTQGVLAISSYHLETIKLTFQHINFAQFENKLRIRFFTALLNVQNIKDWKCFLEDNFAILLISLILKQCPDPNNNNTIEEVSLDPYRELKELYAKSNFDLNYLVHDKCVEKKDNKNSNRTFNLDNEMLSELIKQVTKIVETCNTESIDQRFCLMVLVYKMLNNLIEYNVIEKAKITECQLFTVLQNLITDTQLCKSFQQYKTHRETSLKCLINIADILAFLFSIRNNITDIMKNLVSVDFIRAILNIVNFLQEEPNESQIEHKAQIALVNVIGKYSFISIKNYMNVNQNNVMLAIINFEYDFKNILDFNLIMTFLNNIKYANIGFIPEEAVGGILECLKNMCSERYHCYTSTLNILSVFKDLYPHIHHFSNTENKIVIIKLLKPFYSRLNSYGPNVAVALLECIKVLCQIDTDFTYSQWDNKALIMYVPELLSHNYQKVRYKVIEVLIEFFLISTKIGKLNYIHRLEVLFSIICTETTKLFEAEAEPNDTENQQDETLFRVATALYVFLKLMVNCDDFIEESLFAIIKMDYEKNIRAMHNGEIINKAFSTLANHFGSEQFLNKYLENIIKKWINSGYNINLFPFKTFNCTNKLDLYQKHFDTCFPLLLGTDKFDLFRVAADCNMNEYEVLKKYCAKIFVNELINGTHNGTSDKNLLRNNNYLSSISEDQLKEILKSKMDEILVDLLAVVTDEQLILEKFHENVLFLVKGINFTEFRKSLKYVEKLVFGNTSIIQWLCVTDLDKVQKILIELQCEVYRTELREQLKRFHHYTIFIDLIKGILTNRPSLITNFLRDTIHHLINLTKNYCNDQRFSKIVLVYLEQFLESILPAEAERFDNFFLFTVNSIKNFELLHGHLSTICIKILNFLIVDNTLFFKANIAKLDEFPQKVEYNSIRQSHAEINSEYKTIQNPLKTFEEELRVFIESSDTSIRQDSLIHLKENLINNKQHLKLMYEKLEKTNGFSEQCETSLLHRLICTLVKLSCSSNQSISFGAIKCLGEIGPANLGTLVLEPEKRILETKADILELFTGHIVSLLIQYTIDSDINVVKATNDALVDVIKTKESVKVIDSNENYGYGVINKEFISFYLEHQQRRKPTNAANWNLGLLAPSLNNSDVWCPSEWTKHSDWLTSLVSTILNIFGDNFYFKSLISLCNVKVKFCEQILPLLIYVLLTLNNSDVFIGILSSQINNFFSSHWHLAINQSAETNVIPLNKKSVKCMLDVINFIRQQASFSQSFDEKLLKLNYLAIAKAAAFCSAHFSALLYAEIWCQEQLELIPSTDSSVEGNTVKAGYTQLEYLYENIDEETGVTLHNILQNAYKSIGDLDALGGCGLIYLLQPEHRVEYYKNLGRWKDVMYYYSVLPKECLNLKREYLIESFKKNQFYQLPLMCSGISDEPQYECLWRLGEWNTNEKDPLRFDEPLTPKTYEKYKFYSLKSMCENDEYTFSKSAKQLIFCIIDKLKHTSLESSKNIYPILTELQSLVEMEDLMIARKSDTFDTTFEKWMNKDVIIRKNDFEFIEPVAAQRLTLLNEYVKQCPEQEPQFFKMIFNFADYAIQECQIRAAEDAMFHIKKLPHLNKDIKNQLLFKEVQLAWLNNDKMIALQLLRKLCGQADLMPRLKAQILKLQGEYMAESYLERTTILHSFFGGEKLFKELNDSDSDDQKALSDIYDKIAAFADKEYQQIMDHTKSDLFQKKVTTWELSKKINAPPRCATKNLDELRAVKWHQVEKKIDEVEISNVTTEKNYVLCLALKYYLKNLIMCDTNNIKIFRIMSLFLENRNIEIIKGIVDEMVPKIPSYKYIIMLPQLVPHISENSAELFSLHINRIVMKCAVEHPHHTLPLLLALVNAYEDRKHCTDRATEKSSSNDRIKTAKSMIDKLKKDRRLAGLIANMQFVSEALIELAYYPNPNDGTRTHKIPAKFKIHKIKHFDGVLVPTCTLTVSKLNNYTDITGIRKFSPTYSIVGGINAPKRIECFATDGTTYTQLVKGKDDLRQDAVMQQVFQIMNDLLSTSKHTKHLHIRTYKIVALSMRSGVLEWVPNSMPIYQYLAGNPMDRNDKGAHIKYRPNDYTPRQCRSKLDECKNSHPDKKLKVYNDICQNFKPVFHKFFETHFPQPSIWYERRRAYIYSVATSSMCGYILGIGDRHLSNILIDKQTAEVIHIDFGIAFEQGKCLHTPETIPFRLTRDIVDGMGVSGIEGLFRKSCEKSMDVLRSNSQTILTILEVLLYDPLYFWTVTPAEANKRQMDEVDSEVATDEPEEIENKNVTAERALLRLKCKLQGTEGSKPTSVEQQVGGLIQQAMDPVNLCRPYCGWGAYL